MANPNIIESFKNADTTKDLKMSPDELKAWLSSDAVHPQEIATLLNTPEIKSEVIRCNDLEKTIEDVYTELVSGKSFAEIKTNETAMEICALRAGLYLGYTGGMAVDKKEEGPALSVVKT
jgi:precorrin-6B methylase 1